MLIYTKIVDDQRHLFGTLNNLPSDDDIQLTYKNAEGEEVADISVFKFFYGTKNALFAGESDRQVTSDKDTQISVWIGDEAVLGVEEDEEEETEEEQEEEVQEEEPVAPVTTTVNPTVTTTSGSRRGRKSTQTTEEVEE